MYDTKAIAEDMHTLRRAFPQTATEAVHAEHEIPREMDSLRQSVEHLDKAVAVLIDRLDPVMHRRPGDAAGNVAAAEAPIGTALGGEIDGIKRRIKSLTEALAYAAQNLAI